MGNRILITGHRGFLGSHMGNKLKAEDHEVFEFNGDVIEEHCWGIIHNVSHVVNLAGYACPSKYLKDRVRTFKTMVMGTVNALEFCRRKNARLLQVSAAGVYGEPDVSPQTESYYGNANSVGPRSCYVEGKRAAETVCWNYQEQYGVDVRIARPFNSYGPGAAVDDGHAIPTFITKALKNEPITVTGNGEQTLSFVYVDDLIEGLMKLMESEVKGPVNLGHPAPISTLALAELIVSITNSKSEIKVIDHDGAPYCRPAVTHWQPDIRKARRELGWEPKVPLIDGLERTIRYFETILMGESLEGVMCK